MNKLSRTGTISTDKVYVVVVHFLDSSFLAKHPLSLTTITIVTRLNMNSTISSGTRQVRILSKFLAVSCRVKRSTYAPGLARHGEEARRTLVLAVIN